MGGGGLWNVPNILSVLRYLSLRVTRLETILSVLRYLSLRVTRLE